MYRLAFLCLVGISMTFCSNCYCIVSRVFL